MLPFVACGSYLEEMDPSFRTRTPISKPVHDASLFRVTAAWQVWAEMATENIGRVLGPRNAQMVSGTLKKAFTH